MPLQQYKIDKIDWKNLSPTIKWKITLKAKRPSSIFKFNRAIKFPDFLFREQLLFLDNTKFNYSGFHFLFLNSILLKLELESVVSTRYTYFVNLL